MGGRQTEGAAASPALRRRCDVLGWVCGLPGLAQREMARTRARSLAIGDGANDVAMIQARSCCTQSLEALAGMERAHSRP